MARGKNEHMNKICCGCARHLPSLPARSASRQK